MDPMWDDLSHPPTRASGFCPLESPRFSPAGDCSYCLGVLDVRRCGFLGGERATGQSFQQLPRFCSTHFIGWWDAKIHGRAVLAITAIAIISVQVRVPLFGMKSHLTSACKVFIAYVRPHVNVIHSLTVLDIHSLKAFIEYRSTRQSPNKQKVSPYVSLPEGPSHSWNPRSNTFHMLEASVASATAGSTKTMAELLLNNRLECFMNFLISERPAEYEREHF